MEAIGGTAMGGAMEAIGGTAMGGATELTGPLHMFSKRPLGAAPGRSLGRRSLQSPSRWAIWLRLRPRSRLFPIGNLLATLGKRQTLEFMSRLFPIGRGSRSSV